MNLTHFGLRRRPFRATPDTDSYYAATVHETALAELQHALAADESLLLLSGATGTGKTLLVRRFLEALDETIRPVLLLNSHFANRMALLQGILFDLGLPYQDVTEQVARLTITESCLEHFRTGGKTLLVIDEAHHLSAELLEELRLFANLEGKDGKAVQVLLVALPTMEQTLATPSLAAFRQRLTVRAKLEPLSLEESADYLLHQVRVAGGTPDLFGEDVLDILTHAALGIPRVLNQAASLAFSLAYEARTEIVDSEAAVEAITRLGLDPIHEGEPLEPEDIPPQSYRLPAATVLVESPKHESARQTIPFTPVILPIHDGPPTFVYGNEADGRAKPEVLQPADAPAAPSGAEPWGNSSDRVG